MQIEDTIQKIIKKSGRTRVEIKELIQEQIEELSGLIDEEGAIVIVAKNLGVDLKENQEAANLEFDQKISALKPRMNANIIGRIIEIEDIRKFNKKDGSQGLLLPFIIQDKSGMIRCLAWGDLHGQIINESGFTKKESIRIVNGFIKESRTGAMEIHIGAKSRIQLQPDDIDHHMIPTLKEMGNSSILKIGEVNLSYPFVDLEGIVTNIFTPKEFTRKDGGKGQRASIKISDESGQIFITFWGDHCQKMVEIAEGDKITITKSIPKPNYMDKSKIDLTATSNTEIKIIEKSNGSFKANIQDANTISKISHFLEIEGFGSIEGKIQDIDNIKILNMKDGSQKKILKFVLADETGAIRVNLWEEKIPEFDLKVNDVILMEGVSFKNNSYSNSIEASLTRKGTINIINKKIKTTATLPVSDFSNQNKKLNRINIEEISKADFYEFKGSIIKEINRITTYSACSKCNRKIDNCSCENKGKEVNRMILNILLNDESSTIRATLMGEKAEEFLGEKTDRIVELTEAGEIDHFLKTINRNLIGKEYIFRGKARYSNFSESYEVSLNSFQEIDPESESKYLIELIEAN